MTKMKYMKDYVEAQRLSPWSVLRHPRLWTCAILNHRFSEWDEGIIQQWDAQYIVRIYRRRCHRCNMLQFTKNK